MNENVKYSHLRRSVEKKLTRKTSEKERLLIKWMIDKSIKNKEISHT